MSVYASYSQFLGSEWLTPCKRMCDLRQAHSRLCVLVPEQLQKVCTVGGQGATIFQGHAWE